MKCSKIDCSSTNNFGMPSKKYAIKVRWRLLIISVLGSKTHCMWRGNLLPRVSNLCYQEHRLPIINEASLWLMDINVNPRCYKGNLATKNMTLTLSCNYSKGISLQDLQTTRKVFWNLDQKFYSGSYDDSFFHMKV